MVVNPRERRSDNELDPNQQSLLIDYNNIIAPNNLQRLCDRIEPQIFFKKRMSFKHSDLCIGLILITSPRQIKIFNKIPLGNGRVSYINSEEFVNSIEEYAYLIYDKGKKIVEIVLPNKICVFLKEILETVLIGIPENVTLWVCVNINHSELMSIVDVYVKAGYHNPYIYKSSPLGNVFDTYSLCMFRKNKVYNTNHSTNQRLSESDNVINDVFYVLRQFIDRREKNCTMTARLKSSTVTYLKKLCLECSTKNGDNSTSQKEIAGSLKVSSVDSQSDHSSQNKCVPLKNFSFVPCVNQELEINKDSIIYGKEEGVPIVKARYNFHTHPREAYVRNNVGMGWPSAQDYIGYMSAVIQFKTIFHLVISLEGIYIISIGEYWVDKLQKLNKKTIAFVKNNYDIRHTKGKDIEWYLRTINELRYKGHPLILLQFLSWEEAGSDFTVYYLRNGDNCFIREETLEKYNKFYTEQE